MKLNQVAAQLYSVRDYTKTPVDVAKTLKKIRQIGYQAVQVSGMGPIAEEDLKKILDGEGLYCCVTHEPGLTILNEPQKAIDRLKKLNCPFTAYPYPANIDLSSKDAVLTLAKQLDSSGSLMQKAGITLTYHNHALEFRKIENQTVLDMIYANTDKRHLMSELDTYWVQAGGGDSIAWCKKLAGRLPLIHLKDYGIDANNNPAMREIGSGNLDWPGIISAAEKSGCKWFIVEQDGNWINNDPFESLRISYNYIRDYLCE
jgi:sugar phosphate isomerase/epimerase